MNLQLRIVAAMVVLALLAITTVPVLVLAYVFAALSLGAIVFILGRKSIKRIADARLSRPLRFPRPSSGASGSKDGKGRLAA